MRSQLVTSPNMMLLCSALTLCLLVLPSGSWAANEKTDQVFEVQSACDLLYDIDALLDSVIKLCDPAITAI